VRFLLDTNAWVVYLNDPASIVGRHLASVHRRDVALCDVVRAELLYGAHRSSRRDANLSLVRYLDTQFQSLPFDGRAAEECGRIRALLAFSGTPIGPYDFMIASIALANDLTLVPHNTREFVRVPGLRLDDWEIV
jgi:tRNA(fMet)-specific endonuclease VapC